MKQATSAAVTANKPIMMEFWADWCEPCKVMDREVYSDPQVADAVMRNVVPLRLSFDQDQKSVREYNVEAIPYIVFTTSYGTELLHNRGLLHATELTAIIQALPANLTKLNELDGARRSGNNSFDVLRQFGDELRAAGMFESSNDFYQQAVKTDFAKKHSLETAAVLRAMASNFRSLRDEKQAAAITERVRKLESKK